jgi:hypothetical protein
VYDIPFYAFSRTFRDAVRGCTCCRMVYWLAGRQHLLEETAEEAFTKLREKERSCWGRRGTRLHSTLGCLSPAESGTTHPGGTGKVAGPAISRVRQSGAASDAGSQPPVKVRRAGEPAGSVAPA